MSEKLQFADDIQRFFAMFPGIKAYAEQVGKVGSLEQSATEAENRIAKAKQDYEMQAAQLNTAHKVHLDAVEHAKQKAAEASGDVSRILSAAHEEAEKIINEATAKADKIAAMADQATEGRRKALQALDSQIAAKKAELEHLAAEQTAEEATLHNLTARKQQFQDSLKELKAKL